MGVVPHAGPATEAFGEAPYGATKRVRGAPKWGVELHADPASVAFGGAPYWATNRVRGAPKWKWNCMRTLPLGPSVDPRDGCAEMVD